MAIEVKRKKGETFESFLRRFNKRMIQSHLVSEFKTNAHHRRVKSRNLLKGLAIEKLKYKDQMERLKKAGRLPEEKQNKRRR